MRLFLAIRLAPPVKEALGTTLDTLKREGKGRWTRPELLHLTVEFLGEQPSEEGALAALGSVSAPPFSLTFSGLGRFRGRGGDILWYGVEASPQLLELHRQLRRALKEQGIQTEDRPYRPHLTLGRQVTCAPALPAPSLCQRVEEVALMESVVEGGRRQYRCLAVRRLKEPVGERRSKHGQNGG